MKENSTLVYSAVCTVVVIAMSLEVIKVRATRLGSKPSGNAKSSLVCAVVFTS